ncbi:hypothetical protein ACFE04_013350 [Oxalis oulophora]
MDKARKPGSARILLALGFLLSFIGKVSSLSITVTEQECVSEHILFDGDSIFGNFVVMDHDIFWNAEHPGIEFSVLSPTDNVIHMVKGTSGDKFELKSLKSGMYKFCFKNPSPTPETISFYIHVGHIPKEYELAQDEHMDPLNIKLAELREALESVTSEQKYYKAREVKHRYINESTRQRVVFYTMSEYFVLAASSALQVIYVRRLFSKSVGYNRV